MRYYEINEGLARRAKESYSFGPYVPGSATKEYREEVDSVYELAEKAKSMVDNEEKKARIDYLADKFSKKYADWKNKMNSITASVPSVMIAGPANFPVKKKEKQIAREEKHMEELKKIENIKKQIRDIAYGKEIIKSGDADAIKQLEQKVNKIEHNQEYMKAANAYYRKHKTMKGYEGITDEKAEVLDKDIEDSWEKKPFATYQLTNNRQNLKAAKDRLERLKKAKSQGNAEKVQNDHFKVVENTEIMRVQFFFDGKPEAEVRDILKKNGFRWSGKNGAWQRHLTENGKYVAKRAAEELVKFYE